MSKHFVFGERKPIDKKRVKKSNDRVEKFNRDEYDKRYEDSEHKIRKEESLIHVYDRVIVKVNVEYKNNHTFSNGQQIRLERQFNNLNRRETEPVNAVVISGENIKAGSEILVHPNATTETYRINDYESLSSEVKTDVRYYSIPTDMCFAWHDGNEWLPLEPFDFALKVYIPYKGFIQGIEPSEVKDVLFVTTGELKNNVVKTVNASDYIVVFRDKNGQESRLLRFRPFGCQRSGREEEAIAILHNDSDNVLSDNYLIGLSHKEAKTYSECFRQQNTSKLLSTDASIS